MATMPITDDAPAESGGLISGIPSAVSYAHLLNALMPQMISESVNKALESHVKEYREFLKKNEEYAELSEYYDVWQTDGGDLEFGMWDLPVRLRALADALEFGDVNHPPQAFVRKAVMNVDKPSGVNDSISNSVRRQLGEVVVEDAN